MVSLLKELMPSKYSLDRCGDYRTAQIVTLLQQGRGTQYAIERLGATREEVERVLNEMLGPLPAAGLSDECSCACGDWPELTTDEWMAIWRSYGDE